MSEAPRGAADGNVEALRQRADDLTARVAELEAELGRRGSTDTSTRESREQRRKEIETELADIERRERELRSERATLLEEYAQEWSARSRRVSSLQLDIDHIDQRLRELRMQRQQRLAELDQVAREPVVEQRAYGAQPSAYSSGYVAGSYAPVTTFGGTVAAGDPILNAGAASYQAFDQLSRMGAGLLYGHLAMLTSAADVVSSVGNEIEARQRARGPVSYPEMVGSLYGDLYAGTMTAVDRVHRVPFRTLQGFHTTGAGTVTPLPTDPTGRWRAPY